MFLLKSFNYLKGYIVVRAEGFFIERLINLCQLRNIKTWDAEVACNGIIEFKIERKDYERLLEIAKISRCNIEKVEQKGAINVAKRYSKRKAFVGVLFVACVAVYLINKRIWSIEIQGNKEVSLNEIYQELEQENLKKGILKDELDFAKIKSNIYQRRSDILWLGFSLKGTTLKVEVIERKNPEEDEFKNKPCNIVADKTGIIESIYVKEGTANAQKGDVIYEGDLLVNGVVTSEHSDNRYVSANAEISLKTWYEGKVAIPYEKTLLIKSGNRHNTYKLSVRKLCDKFVKY